MIDKNFIRERGREEKAQLTRFIYKITIHNFLEKMASILRYLILYKGYHVILSHKESPLKNYTPATAKNMKSLSHVSAIMMTTKLKDVQKIPAYIPYGQLKPAPWTYSSQPFYKTMKPAPEVCSHRASLRSKSASSSVMQYTWMHEI